MVRGVYIVNTEDIDPHRNTKHCVCVSVNRHLYFRINTEQRPHYDDFKLCASDYPFLGQDRFLGCSRSSLINRDDTKIIRKVGVLTVKDTATLIAKLETSHTIPKPDARFIIIELGTAYLRKATK